MEQIEQALAVMLAAFPSSNTNASLVVTAYLMAIKDLPKRRIATAIDDFICGKVPNSSKTFAPSAAEFAAHVRTIPMSAAEQNDYVAQHKVAYDTSTPKQLPPRAGPTEKLTPEARARITAMKAAFDKQCDEYTVSQTPKPLEGDDIFTRTNKRFDSQRGVAGMARTPLTAADLTGIPDRGEPYGFRRPKAQVAA